MEPNVKLVCSACLTEACAQGVQLCEESRHAGFALTHALHEDGCPICRTSTAITRKILEALCHRDGISLDSDVEPGKPARNYELADRLGIPDAFKLTASEPGLPPMAEHAGRVLRDVTLVGEVVLDPRYDPPWPGAGIKSIRKSEEPYGSNDENRDRR